MKSYPGKCGWLIGTVLLAVLLSVVNCEYSEECAVMQRVSDEIDEQERVSMTCQPNRQCVGFDCSGSYTYRGTYSAMDNITVDFCFGMALHPCRPTEAHFYVNIPDKGTDFNRNLTTTDRVQLQDVHYTTSDVYQADGFVDIEKFTSGIEERYGGRKYITMAMKFRMRISVGVGFFRRQFWPDDFEFIMVPDGTYFMPICDHQVSIIDAAPYCNAVTSAPHTTAFPRASNRSTKKPIVSTTEKPMAQDIPIDENGHKLPCNFATILNASCGLHQACDQDSGYCRCQKGYTVHSMLSDQCTATNVTEEFSPVYAVKESNMKHVATLAGSATGALILLCIFVGILVFMYRRYRSSHAQNNILNNATENQADDDPIDIST